MVIRAAKSNEARTRAIGLSPYPYRLLAFVLAGAIGGVAGALYANHTAYITPGLMSWQQSGELMFMVILGGMASASGPLLGAAALILLEEALKAFLDYPGALFGARNWGEHWQVVMGPLLVLCVIFFKRGLAGILARDA
jgi:branched-chain amino acid transport system permease protein